MLGYICPGIEAERSVINSVRGGGGSFDYFTP
ncbi:Uncharacterised protein [Mycobacteroides abscessus subsp. abscessus]|nr:Uncharacterised protein [Mycobacteroides abscessus subsp. abscessus]SKT62276.1 Uncharacterised protein [Mycobacteroides abscessus subsp. abscessus]SKX53939.1 Uncharacterised protein [Mycobacteroides abscessus subsp. abscessus]